MEQKSQKDSSLQNHDFIKEFLANQKAQINLDTEALKLKHEELKANTKLAEKSMELQAAYLANQPQEGRKSITRIGYIIGEFVIVFLSFIAYCLYLKEDVFLISFLKNAGYVFTTLMGYWFGRRVGKENERNKEATNPIQEVEILKDSP